MALPVQGWVGLSAVAITGFFGALKQWLQSRAFRKEFQRDFGALKLRVKRINRREVRTRDKIAKLTSVDDLVAEQLIAIKNVAKDNGDNTAAALNRLGGIDAKLELLLKNKNLG